MKGRHLLLAASLGFGGLLGALIAGAPWETPNEPVHAVDTAPTTTTASRPVTSNSSEPATTSTSTSTTADAGGETDAGDGPTGSATTE